VGWPYSLKKLVHWVLKPLWKNFILYARGISHEQLQAKYQQGWDIQLVAGIHKALFRFAEEIPPAGDPGRRDAIKAFADVLCLMLDSERFWTPRWWNIMLKIAQDEGLLKPVPEPER